MNTDSALRILAGTYICILSWVLVAIVDFNAATIYYLGGRDNVEGLMEWFSYVQSHREKFGKSLFMDVGVGFLGNLIFYLLFAMPVLALLASYRARKIQYCILLFQLLLLWGDVKQVLAAEGYTSGNGGYDLNYLLVIHWVGAIIVFALGLAGLFLSWGTVRRLQ